MIHCRRCSLLSDRHICMFCVRELMKETLRFPIQATSQASIIDDIHHIPKKTIKAITKSSFQSIAKFYNEG